jgi:SAM-dependent methyltransferase
MSPATSSVSARGAQRFQTYARSIRAITGTKVRGRLLDFGCGAGGFLKAALDAGLDAYGVEVEQDRLSQYESFAAADQRARFVLYDGGMLPFDGRSFDLIYSWFVFEHVQQPGLALREIVRVAKIGALIDLYADDARNHWDGHVSIPVPAFMPRRFTRAYLDVFGLAERADFINDTVFYITAPMITSVLSALGCDVLHENTVDLRRAVPGAADISSDDDARRVAREVKARMDSGEISSPTENLHVLARRVR